MIIKITVSLIFLTFLAPLPLRAEGFLHTSKLLSKTKLQIFPVFVKPNGHILPALEQLPNSKLSLITETGFNPIDKIAGAKKEAIPAHSCGEPVAVFPWYLKNGKALPSQKFALSGNPPANFKVVWVNAQTSAVSPTLKCSKYRDTYKSTLTRYKFKDSKDDIFVSVEKSPDQLAYETALSRTSQKDTPPKIDCNKTDFIVLRTGLISDDKCDLKLQWLLNCEGRESVTGGSYGQLLGKLKIEFGKESEVWLVYEGHGYEGDAYLAIQLNNLDQVNKVNSEFYVYSGC